MMLSLQAVLLILSKEFFRSDIQPEKVILFTNRNLSGVQHFDQFAIAVEPFFIFVHVGSHRICTVTQIHEIASEICADVFGSSH